MTQRKAPADRSKRPDSRQRPHLVGVRLSPAEFALLEAEVQRTGLKGPSVLRDAFLASVRLPG